jgi:subtilisin family serine protease
LPHVPRLTAPFALVLVLALLLAAASPAARDPRKKPAGPKTVAGELLVRFKSTVAATAQQSALARAGVKSERKLRKLNARLVKVDPAEQRRVWKRLAADPRVASVEPNGRVHALAIPNDSAFTELWGLRNTGQTITVSDGTRYTGTPDADIDADEAWDVTTGRREVVVAVIDTGVDFSHPDLGGSRTAANPLMWTNPGETGGAKPTNGIDDDGNGYVDDWRGWDFVNDDNDPLDDEGHGTHVTGTIAANGGNGIGVAGVAWNTRIMALKFLDAYGGGTEADAAEAIAYAAVMGADVLNNSWGGGEESQTLLDAIERTDAAGALFAAAAGNDNYDNDEVDSFPADYEVPNVVSVAGTSQTDERAWFTNTGRQTVDLGAPGENVYSTLAQVMGYGYDHWDGTSMATPHVVGAAALARSAFPASTGAGVKALLLRTVDPRPDLAAHTSTGGRLNAANAVRCSGRPQAWIEQPVAGFQAARGEPFRIVAEGAVCGVPTATVTAAVNGSPVTLAHRGDGLYTGTHTPSALGALDVTVTASAGGVSDSRSVSGTAVETWRAAEEAFSWIDATAPGGTRLDLGDDDYMLVNLPFSVTFDERAFTRVNITSNGFLDFGSNAGADLWVNGRIPDRREPNGIVAPYWDDFDPTTAGAVWYRTVGTAPNRRFVVAWVGLARWRTDEPGGDFTFEAIIEEGTNDIVFQYRDIADGDPDGDNGASATVGVESRSGWVGRQFLHNEPRLAGYANAKALRFTRGAPADTTAPETTIVAGPDGTVVATSASFSFSADEAGAVFECRVDGGAWSVCVSPVAVSGLVPGVRSFEVRARDGAGNVDGSPALRELRVARPFATLGVAVWRPASGVWYRLAGDAVQWGQQGDVPVPADYDGDGDTDIAVWRPSSGVWWVQGLGSWQWGAAEDVPVPADYDGDGDTDIAVWRPSTGVWWVRGLGSWQWGAAGDVPLPGDYDGDPELDLAVWRPSSGTWYVQGSITAQWGQQGDVPVPADYDGDGKDELAVWRPDDGVWYVRGGAWRQWGAAEDIPVPLDSDGDGAAEMAVWRPASGVWYYGSTQWQWGAAGDLP